jgi:hypothetical protein
MMLSQATEQKLLYSRKLWQIGKNEDFMKKTLAERSNQHCLGVAIYIAHADVCRL